MTTANNGATGPRPLYFCLADRRLAYLRIQKCACSTIKHWMARHHPRHSSNPGLGVHSEEAHRTYYDAVTFRLEPSTDWFRFTFVRHPESRFLSFYRDKVAFPRPRTGFLQGTGARLGMHKDMSPLDCLKLIARLPVEQHDLHFAPQTAFMMEGERLLVDFIGRLERFERDAALVQGAANSDLAFERRNAGRAAPETPLGDAERALIRKIYARDFAVLGYGDLPEGTPRP